MTNVGHRKRCFICTAILPPRILFQAQLASGRWVRVCSLEHAEMACRGERLPEGAVSPLILSPNQAPLWDECEGDGSW